MLQCKEYNELVGEIWDEKEIGKNPYFGKLCNNMSPAKWPSI